MNSPEPKAGRNYWPVAIIAYFVCAIIFIVSFTVFASRQREDLVRADYYDEEVHFQKQIEKVKRTDPAQAELAIAYSAQRQEISLQLPAIQSGNATGQVMLYRPSDARLDQRHPLAVSANGAQTINARQLQPGLWKVRVEWSCNGQDYYFDRAIRVRSPQG